MKKNINDEVSSNEKNTSFFEKMKTDKKYNAKVQLIGYGVFIVALVIYVNIASLGSSPSGNSIIGNDIDSDYLLGNKEETSGSLLENIKNNYRYEVGLYIKTKVQGEQEEQELVDSQVRYVGKSYENQLEITKEDTTGNNLYYKVDERYYSKTDYGMEFTQEEVVYDLIDSEYIELDGILALIDKASLDHVTDYSTGKKEYVYHLKVRDIIVSYKLEDVVEIKVEEENGVLSISVDYSSLIHVVDESIEECKLEAKITDIDKIEEFLVLNEEENNSVE